MVVYVLEISSEVRKEILEALQEKANRLRRESDYTSSIYSLLFNMKEKEQEEKQDGNKG